MTHHCPSPSPRVSISDPPDAGEEENVKIKYGIYGTSKSPLSSPTSDSGVLKKSTQTETEGGPVSDPFDDLAVLESTQSGHDEEGCTITLRAFLLGLIIGSLGGTVSQVEHQSWCFFF